MPCLVRETSDAVDLESERLYPHLTAGFEVRHRHAAIGAEAQRSALGAHQLEAQVSAVF
jgi:Arc/MetJ family transcription regulator